MRRATLCAGALLVMTGCQGALVNPPRPTPGMTQNQVFLALGPESGFARDPVDPDLTCLSYAYGGMAAPRYTHALFSDGVLIQATEGHDRLCTLG